MPRQTVNGSYGKAAPHQPPAGGSFSLRAKSRLRRLRFDTRLRAQPQGGKPQILERPTLSGRAFRAGVRNRKRRMAIVKGCNLTPGCVFTVRGGDAASKENGVMWAGCCLRGNNPSRRGTSICARQPEAPCGRIREPPLQKAREKITRYRTACGCSRAGASNPHRRCSRPRRRRHAGHPSRG